MLVLSADGVLHLVDGLLDLFGPEARLKGDI
jgi:hypothetical protein